MQLDVGSPPPICTLYYVHLGFVFVLVAERSHAEGSVGQIFICLKRLNDFHANPKRAGSVGKRRKGFGDPILRFAESLRFACFGKTLGNLKKIGRSCGFLVSSQLHGGGGSGIKTALKSLVLFSL